MSNPIVDYRIERLLNFLRNRWFLLSEKRKSQIWKILLALNSLRYRAPNSRIYDIRMAQRAKTKFRVKAKKPSENEWSLLTTQSFETPVLDVIIPVYKGEEETLRCIFSVLKSKNVTPFELIVINDKSPDEKLISELRKLSKQYKFSLIENPANLGFVKTMNLGMNLHRERDVVWLNSDTEVFNHWLDRLRDIAYHDEKIATVTPLSNNATICSYPVTMADNASDLKCPDEQLDSFCATYNKGEYFEAPTGVGFCMYIKRVALNQVGLLNETAFGKGYGEEVDLCQRFHLSKFKNVVTSSVFVRHYGAISFTTESKLRQAQATKIIDKFYPDYQMRLMDWIQKDPLKFARLKLDAARLMFRHGQTKGSILNTLHSRGGGTEKFVQDLEAKITSAGYSPFILRTGISTHALKFETGQEALYPNLSRFFDISQDFKSFVEIFRILNVKVIHIHQLIDVDPDAILLIIALAKFCEIPIVVSIHDYFCCCNSNLINPKSLELCDKVSKHNCPLCPQFQVDVPIWKRIELYDSLYKNAHKVCVPNDDVAKRLSKVFEDVSFCVVPHFDPPSHNNLEKKWSHKTKVVAIPGAISSIKGSRVLLDLATYIKENHVPLKLVVVGITDCDDWLLKQDVQITGAYSDEEELRAKLIEVQADMIFLPFTCPETFSYTCSEALRTGLPLAVFDLGAPSVRLKNIGLGHFVIARDLIKNIPMLTNRLLELADFECTYSYEGNNTAMSAYYDFLDEIR